MHLIDNLTQAGEQTQKLLIDMARHEMERRENACDKAQVCADKWMLPRMLVAGAKRPWEIYTHDTSTTSIHSGQSYLDANIFTIDGMFSAARHYSLRLR